MTNVFLLCAFALFCAVLWRLVHHFAPAFDGLFLCGASIVFIWIFFRTVLPFLKSMNEILGKTEFDGLFQGLWKAAGICAIVTVSASLCRDMGEEKIASGLELCGKGALLTLSLPLLKQVLDVIGDALT